MKTNFKTKTSILETTNIEDVIYLIKESETRWWEMPI